MRSYVERGFILPLSVLLVLILTISGTSFMQQDFLERRMTMNNVDNQSAFYLANAGIERSKGTFKISEFSQDWTSLLAGTGIPENQFMCGTQPLCPDLSRGCAIAPFGATVSSPEIPFSGTFNTGSYTLRAFNNLDDPGSGTNDTDQILTFRGCGTIRTEQKLLEVTALATSAGNLITCSVSPCPSKASGDPTVCDAETNPKCLPMDGREPGIGPIPEPDFPMTDSENYYRVEPGADPMVKVNDNFPGLLDSYQFHSGDTNLDPQDGRYYFVDGDVILQSNAATNVVIFATGEILAQNVELTNAVLIGVSGVDLRGKAEIRAPEAPYPHYPAIFSGGDVTHSNHSAPVYGNVYAGGIVDINPLNIHGATFGAGGVEIQGSSVFSDDDNIRYYTLMKGFIYDSDNQSIHVITGTWRELL